MKKLIFISTLFLYNLMFAQVGIGTVNPTKELDINGELRIRNLPNQDIATSSVLTTDTDGNIGQSNIFLPSSVSSVVAATNIDRTVSGTRIINNIDLGLSISVTIPAGRNAIVIINYSLPIGISSFTVPNLGGYYGVRFLRNGVERQSGSRKSTVISSLDPNETVNMITIGTIYTENFTANSVDRTITYSLNGYIEQYSTNTNIYRFNMWQPTGPNFNWGKGTITRQLFIN